MLAGNRTVAPFAGAWIETTAEDLANLWLQVAPFAGAWIETIRAPIPIQVSCVAPFAGAWIETSPKALMA
ncbi:hypothetical protein SAMN05421775_11642 [Jannaschia aquimarina]|nr:hypothetical protein SAMN05421775_11642 [Jannaschia aquimarina]